MNQSKKSDLPQSGAPVYTLIFNPHKKVLVSASDALKVWQAPEDYPICWNVAQTIDKNDSHILCAGFNHDGSKLASGSDDGSIKIWKAEKNNLYRLLLVVKNKTPVSCLAFDPHETLAYSYDNTIRFLKENSQNKSLWLGFQATFLPRIDTILDLVFSTDGTTLASKLYDGSIQLFRVNSSNQTLFQCQEEFNQMSNSHAPPVLNNDASALITASPKGTINIWELYNTSLGNQKKAKVSANSTQLSQHLVKEPSETAIQSNMSSEPSHKISLSKPTYTQLIQVIHPAPKEPTQSIQDTAFVSSLMNIIMVNLYTLLSPINQNSKKNY